MEELEQEGIEVKRKNNRTLLLIVISLVFFFVVALIVTAVIIIVLIVLSLTNINSSFDYLQEITYKTNNLWNGTFTRENAHTKIGTLHNGFNMTALDDYVSKPDSVYKWEETGKKYSNSKVDAYQLKLTSHQYMDESKVSPSIWTHDMFVIVPKTLVKDNHHFIYLTGGTASLENDKVSGMALVAQETETVVTVLYGVGNQPLVFASDSEQRNKIEDEAIAYTFSEFFKNTSNFEVLNLLAKTKSAVRGMDATEEFLSLLKPKLEGSTSTWATGNAKWSVGGCSKRGWTSWLTTAYDQAHEKRIELAMPMVLTFIKQKEQLHRWFRSFNGWSYALQDYYNVDFTEKFDSPEFEELQAIIDPISYNDRYGDVILYQFQASHDQFFPVDDGSIFWRDLKFKAKYNIIVPESTHNIEQDPLHGQAIITMIRGVAFEVELPIIDVYVDGTDQTKLHYRINNTKLPKEVKVYHATPFVTDRRDFRYATKNDPCEPPMNNGGGFCQQLYKYQTIDATNEATGHYSGTIAAPLEGYTGYFINGIFEDPKLKYPLILSSFAIVNPNTYPHSDCVGSGCKGTLM